MINQKKYVPDIKKELTIIPEDDISREDSIIDNSTLLLSNKKQKNSDENDNENISQIKEVDEYCVRFEDNKNSDSSEEENNGKNKFWHVYTVIAQKNK